MNLMDLFKSLAGRLGPAATSANPQDFSNGRSQLQPAPQPGPTPAPDMTTPDGFSAGLQNTQKSLHQQGRQVGYLKQLWDKIAGQ